MRSFVLLSASTLLLLVGCGGSAAKPADASDEATDAPASAKASADGDEIGEVSEPVADCDGLDEFTCNITGGCTWSAGSGSCAKESRR